MTPLYGKKRGAAVRIYYSLHKYESNMKERELWNGEEGWLRWKSLQKQLWSKHWCCLENAGVRILYVLLRDNDKYMSINLTK